MNPHKKIILISLLAAFLSFGLDISAAQTVEVRDITFPVEGPSSFRDDFGDPRSGGTREHLGVDIIADKMTPVVSVVNGTVVYAPTSQPSWGYTISIQDSDGYTYRYLHLNNDNIGTDDGKGGSANAYAPGIRRGVKVKKGELIGWVGDSGNAENTLSHLHFEIRKSNRNAINPYPSLVAAAKASLFSSSIRVGTNLSTGHTSGELPIDDTRYYFSEDMTVGTRSQGVRELQTRLKELGFFTSTVTDYYGVLTETAVAKFQISKNIFSSGTLDSTTRAALNEGVSPPSTEAYVLTQNLSVGGRGTEVTQLQMRLKEFGYFQGITVTGYFGTLTRAEVIKFQRAKGIAQTGVVEFITRGYLNGCLSYTGYSFLTGQSCSNLLLPGCTSNSGYSVTTGRSCGTMLLPGCTSNTGYSTVNGMACWNI